MKINKPKNSVEEIYTSCISHYRDPNKKKLMQKILPNIINDENRYKEELKSHKLYEETAHITHDINIDSEDLTKLYTDKLVKRVDGLNFYDKLLAGSESCPYCAKRLVSTLDHYLSKSNYPNFSITPLNLVPCCTECNKNKSDKDDSLMGITDLLYHPYEESLPIKKWLKAEINLIDSRLFFTFRVIPNNVPSDDYIRLNNYIKKLKLDEYYAKEANVEIRRRTPKYKRLYASGGEKALLDYFNDCMYDSQDLEHGVNTFEYVYFEACVTYIDTLVLVLK